jgi:hypothetical protein
MAQVKALVPALQIDPAIKGYCEIIGQLLQATLLITDTYHLAVIARHLGIPTICFGIGGAHATSTISDKKKEIFHLMYQASPGYIFTEELGGNGQELLERAERLLENAEFTKCITIAINAHAEAMELQLVNELRKFL